MLEGIVSEVLNKALGTYIENLDSSKLNLSIWGGDVELRDLSLRQSAFDDLNLPFRPVLGHVGRLTLKIPWAKLYTEQWVAVVEKVIVVVVPNTSIRYDPAREEKLLHESKMATLQRAEEARLKQQQEGTAKSASQSSFHEKLFAQVIRNIQVTIKSIHIRYEDSVSCHGSPFAAGFTLHDLSVKSTNCDWLPCLDTDELIYKLNILECLGVYWNPNAVLLSQSQRSKEEMILCLTELIASEKHQPQGMNYVVGPICSSAKLQINTKPEENKPSFSIPVIFLDFVMDTLAIGVSRHQYTNIMALLDSFDRLRVSSKYRRYRPDVSHIKGHVPLWWRYAFECKLEDIRRVHRNWSWAHIKEHRNTFRHYKALYKSKLENKKLSTQQVIELEACERQLDLFNITLVRRQAEMEVEREGELRKQERQNRGWFSGWFSSSSEKKSGDATKEGNLAQKLKEAMSDEEKKKLYQAIGYSESGPPPDYPKQFVNLCLNFLLKQLVLTVRDEAAGGAKIMKVKLEHVMSAVNTRSGAGALNVEASVRGFFVDGYSVAGWTPRLITSETSKVNKSLLNVVFETSPLDGTCDQRVRVKSEPLKIVYDANTVNQLGSVFSPPKNVSLQQLQAAALNQLEVVKERSVSGLQTAIDNHSILDLDVAFAASHIVIPERGSFSKDGSAIILNLGSLLVKSAPRNKEEPRVAELVSLGHSQKEVMDMVRSSSYDHFTLELVDIQALVAFSHEDWESTLKDHKPSPLHLLEPMTLHVDLFKCLLTNDPNLPKVKIKVSLQSVALSIVDERLLQVACIVHSIPLDQKTPSEDNLLADDTSLFQQQDDVKLAVITEDVALARLERTKLNPKGEQQETPQFTNLSLTFKVGEVSLELKKASGVGYQPLARVSVLSAGVELTQRTFDLTVSVVLGGLSVKYLEGEEKWLVSTPVAEGISQALLTLMFKEVNPKSPEFESIHASTARLLCVDVTDMKASLEQSAILNILAFVEQMNYRLGQLAPVQHVTETKPPPDDSISIAESWKKIKTAAVASRKKQTSSVVQLKVVAKLGQVSLTISLQSHVVARVDVAGLVVNVLMKDKDITITSQLNNFSVVDPNPTVLHPKIVEVVGNEAWDAHVAVYGEATDGSQYLDMQRVDTSITLTFGCARIVFLNRFVTDVLNWVDKFQTAKAALANASMAAAVAAQAGLQQAYEKCSRISLSLTLRAPLILVPQDSSSLSGLMVDLGKITINNKFELGQERNELGYPAIYDKIDVQLHNIQVARVVLSCEGLLEQEHKLLQPISLNISVCRNLAISWHKRRPELELQANLKPIIVCLSEADLRVVMSVLNSNFAEQSTVPPGDAVPTTKTSVRAVEREREVERVLAEQGHVFTKVKFSFTIEAVTLSLLRGGSDHLKSPASSSKLVDTTGDSTSPYFSVNTDVAVASTSTQDTTVSGITPPTSPLADVSLDVVTLKGEMMSDGSLVANLVLFDCILQDTRPDQEGYITKMMARKASTSKSGMIDFTYRMEASKDSFADVRVSGFVLVVHLPYLLMIQRFFTDNLLPPPDKQAPPPPTKTKEVSKPKTEAKAESRSSSVMTIRVKVEQPDIALVEDVSSRDTSCIILHAEANCSMKMSESHQHITAGVTNIQMYSCCYNPNKRQKTLSQILERTEMTFLCSLTPVHAEHIDVKLSQVHLRVSPGTIELLSSISKTLSSLEKPKGESVIEVHDWTGLWDAKPLGKDLPFFTVDEAQEAIVGEEAVVESPVDRGPGGEVALVALECLLVTLESGSVSSRIPLMKLQASVSANAVGFRSQKLSVTGELNLEIAYYNPRLAVWEPLLEPVEVTSNIGPPQHLPWKLRFDLTQDLSSGTESSGTLTAGSPAGSPGAEEQEFEEVMIQDPVTVVSVTAQDPLELTVTKTFMEVLTSLSEVFADAYKGKFTDAKVPQAPYRIINQTGMHISVAVIDSGFQVLAEGGENVDQVMVESGAQVDLFEVKPPTPKHRRVASLVAECQTIQDRNILVKIPVVGCVCSIPVARADKRFFQVDHKKGGEKWGLVASISVDSGCKVITLSSCVQVTNHLDVTVDVYYMTERGNEVEFVLSLKQDESALLPLHAVYTPTAELFFSVKGHSVCCVPFIWRQLQNNPGLVQELQCVPRDTQEVHSSPFFIAAMGTVEQILWENTNRRTMKSTLHMIDLHPCLVLNNLLPVPISLEPPGTTTSRVIMPGSSLHLTKARLGAMYLELQLLDYQSRDWVCGKSLDSNPPELNVWTFESRGDTVGGPLHLDLGMLVSRSGPSVSLNLYCPFWMVNKTGLMLTYKADDPNDIVVHEGDNSIAILFSFRSRAFFGKKKAAVKVEDSDWSSKFPLDVVGSSGSVTCKASSRNYQVGLDIQLGNSGLTKIVIFSPFYKILNKAPFDLEVIEVGVLQAEWFTVLSGECIGWWPLGSGHLLNVRVRGTKESTAALSYDEPLSTFLALHNKYGGLVADVSVAEGGVLIKLDQCYEGAPTALLINHLSDVPVCLWQEGYDGDKVVVEPQTMVYYTWAAPGGVLKAVWSCDTGTPTSHTLNKDDQGTMDSGNIHWVVFLHNNQRCLLFTDNVDVATAAMNTVELERIDQDVVLSLNSIALSLVDDRKRKEVAYISLRSSGVVWEHYKLKGKKRRPFTQAQTEQLERAYQTYQSMLKTQASASDIESNMDLGHNLKVDYATLTVSKPFHRKICRTFQPGIWFQLKNSWHQRQLHLKVNSLQIDNQMSDVIFPVVLARVPPPRSVVAETVPKPFCEVSVAQRVMSSMFTQYKYFAVLIQEFHVKVELPFVFAILEVVTSSTATSTNLYSVKKYEKDISVVHESLAAKISSQASSGQRDYFDNLHLSPIKMHLSFSLTGLESGGSVPVGGQVIHLFLQSVGVTLTEVQDIVFRLAYLERTNLWMSWSHLVQEMIVHYRGQVIKQLYVLVLGLDVIGNPIGLVVGLTKGVEDLFYEPIQGAIEGPGEFAEGMLLGVSSFMGKSVGGAAGAMSRITGTIGKGVAALTLDEEYQKRRREAMHRKPADGVESLARGGKGVVTGVVDGVTGVFLKPIDGAREEGVEGFFKGMGKGVVGLVTRPASGVIDFASGSLDTVMRATDLTTEVGRHRPARFIATDSVVRPYTERCAQGAKILQELEKGRYAKTDMYVAHANVASSKSILMATNKRVMLVTRMELLGHLKVDWMHGYDELSEPPVVTPKGLRLSVKQERKRVLGVFGGGDNSKVVQISPPDQAKWLESAMREAYLKFQK